MSELTLEDEDIKLTPAPAVIDSVVQQASTAQSKAAAGASARALRWGWVRHPVQAVIFLLFLAPPLWVGWGLFGTVLGGDDPIQAPRDLLFSGTLTSSQIGGIMLLDPFSVIQMAAASKTFLLDWLIFAAPVLIVYGLVRGRAFCGWVCPVNFVLEIVEAGRRRFGKAIGPQVLPRHTKVWVAVGVVGLSFILSVPIFEAFNPISAINKGIVLGATTGLVVFVAVVAVEIFWGHRIWCRSLCPLGGFYEVLGKVGLVNASIKASQCVHCDACKKACLADPAILDPVLEGTDTLVRAGDCMACGACVDTCPTHALSLKIGRTAISKRATE